MTVTSCLQDSLPALIMEYVVCLSMQQCSGRSKKAYQGLSSESPWTEAAGAAAGLEGGPQGLHLPLWHVPEGLCCLPPLA